MNRLRLSLALTVALLSTGALRSQQQDKKNNRNQTENTDTTHKTDTKARLEEAKANAENDFMDKPVDPDFHHAPEEAREAWLDRKFGMRIHWGVYSQLGLDASWPTADASPEFREIYSTLWQVFNPTAFDADEWAKLAEDAGMKYFVFTTKHHDGFSLFDTKTTVNVKMRKPEGRVKGMGRVVDTVMHYSIMETPFKRDVVKELADAFRKRHMGIGFYYSNPDWNDSNQRFIANNLYYDSNYTLARNPDGFRAAVKRQLEQLTELCVKYGPVDQFDFDHALPPELWDETVNMIKTVRKLQPNALFRQRGLGKYGDFETPEHWLPKDPNDPRLQAGFLWQAIEQFGSRWAWQPNDAYKGKEWILGSLIDCASKGGNFMVGISPMPNGRFDQTTKDALRWVGRWLKVNGESIYRTRGFFGEDSTFSFTRSKDSTIVYAIHKGWFAGRQARIRHLKAKPGSIVSMPGLPGALRWRQEGGDLLITVPMQRPACEYAYVVKVRI